MKWVAAITLDGTERTKFCGGSLIDKQWVLTAAHCDVHPDDKVIIGATDLTRIPARSIFLVTDVVSHAGYNATTHANDIALLKLDKPVETADIEPVQLLESPIDLAAQQVKVTVAGWGATKEGGAQSTTLQEVQVPVISNTACAIAWASEFGDPSVTITLDMLCAGATMKDSCQGDSGGPVAIPDAGKWREAGIVSFGNGCGRKNIYGVYTRVSSYVPWIRSCVTVVNGAT